VKSKNGKLTEDPAKKEGSLFRRDFVVFIFFFVLAFVFWYLNSLEKEIETDIRYHVRFVNVPGKTVIVEESSSRLNLYLKGQGYSLLKLKVLGNKTPVLIDISKVNYKRVPGSSSADYFIVTSGLTKTLNIQLRSGCEITSIKPDTLFFALAKKTGNPDQSTSDNKDDTFSR
jgi:hypothetical protein